MRQLFDGLSVSSKTLLVVGITLTVLAAPLIIYDITAKHQQIEDMAKRHANAALDMLEAIYVQPIIHHGQTEDTDAAAEILNDSLEQFSEINENVNLWFIMGPKSSPIKKRPIKTS